MTTPVVSISVVTYNHADFIQQCLEGLISQKTNFPFEILLGEDDSKDTTRSICLDYAERYPNLIRLFLHSRDTVITINDKPTGRFNFINNIKSAKGKYIAICEGDDYWTDQYKLQKQVNFLENNSGYTLVFNNCNQLINNRIVEETRYVGEFSFLDFITKKRSDYMPLRTVSSMFKRDVDVIDFFSREFRTTQIGDYPLFLLMLTKGKGYCLEDVMCVRRRHTGGVSNNFQKIYRLETRIQVLESFLKNGLVPEEYIFEVKKILNSMNKKYFSLLLRKRKWFKATHRIKHMINSSPNITLKD